MFVDVCMLWPFVILTLDWKVAYVTHEITPSQIMSNFEKIADDGIKEISSSAPGISSASAI